MTARFRKLLHDLGETFWLVPGAMVLAGVLLAVLLIRLDRSGLVPASSSGTWPAASTSVP